MGILPVLIIFALLSIIRLCENLRDRTRPYFRTLPLTPQAGCSDSRYNITLQELRVILLVSMGIGYGNDLEQKKY